MRGFFLDRGIFCSRLSVRIQVLMLLGFFCGMSCRCDLHKESVEITQNLVRISFLELGFLE